jgi:radical SAM superfamily enzyme YgiQ (UPF0313 family)
LIKKTFKGVLIIKKIEKDRKMKILLLSPHTKKKKSYLNKLTYPSLTLQQIAGITPKKHEVEIIDERYETIDFRKNYDLVGITSLTYNSFRAYEISRKFREKNIPVVIGGYHASLMPDEVKEHADAIVVGEGELTWPKLLKDLEKGDLKKIYKTERLVKPEEIPPARHDIGNYTFMEGIQVSRGCPTGCEFCAMNRVEGRIFRARPVEDVIDEMKKIKSKSIFFADASLTINPKYTKKLFRKLSNLNKKFYAFGNINVVAKDDEFLELAKKAGVVRWYLGIESISQESIDSAGKGTNKVEDYEKAIQKIKKHDMKVTGFFVFGLDYDTTDIFDETLKAMYDWGLDSATFSILTPYPGTPLFDRFEKEGRIISYDWSRYEEGKVNFIPKEMTADELYEGIRRIAGDFYSVKNCFNRSIKNNGFNVIDVLTSFFSGLSNRYFYKHEKLNI